MLPPRIGGASALFAVGCNPEHIKAMGRWWSGAYKLYIRAVQGNAQQFMVNACSRSQALGHPQSLACSLACAHSAHASNPPARTFRVGGIWYSQYVMKKRSTTRLYRNSALPGPCHLLATSTPCLSSVLLMSASEEPRLNLFSTI